MAGYLRTMLLAKKNVEWLLLLMCISLMLSVSAAAQHRGGGGGGGGGRGSFGASREGGGRMGDGMKVGGGFIPPHGPSPSRGMRGSNGISPSGGSGETRPNFADREGHPNAPHVHWNGNGLDTTSVETIHVCTSIIRGCTDAFPAGLVHTTSSVYKVVVLVISGLAETFSVLRPSRLACALTGCGIATTLCFTTTQTIRVGISRTTSGSARMCTCCIWAVMRNKAAPVIQQTREHNSNSRKEFGAAPTYDSNRG